jgi:uncharacterized protein (TIGR02118 family)
VLKLVYVITRRADHTPARFYDYWLNTHGPLVAAQAKALRLRRYVQSHLIDHPANEVMRSARGMLPPVDGITEVWWDSLAEMQAAYATDEGAASGRVLAADEAKFIDFANSQVFLTQEHPVFDRGDGPGPDPVKAIYLVQRRSDVGQAECHRTWLADHGPLVTRLAPALNMRRCVQSHTVENEVNAGFQAGAGLAPPLDGIAEMWFGSLAEFEQGNTTAAGQLADAALAEDERRFVDWRRSRLFLTREHTIFDHTR